MTDTPQTTPLNPGETLPRLLFQRVIRDCRDTMPRDQVVTLVARMLGISRLEVGLDIGIDNIEGWKPR